MEAAYVKILWGALAASGALLAVWLAAVARSDEPPEGASERSIRFRRAAKAMVFVLGVLLLAAGGYGLWRAGPVEPTVSILTGLSGEELRLFGDVIRDFEREHGLKVNVENRDWNSVLPRDRAPNLKELEAYDLVTWDITWRYELLQSGAIQTLNEIEERHRELPPSSINPVVIRYLRQEGDLYFLPYRLDVQVLFANDEMLRNIERWCEAYRAHRDRSGMSERSGTVSPLFISIDEGSFRSLPQVDRDFLRDQCIEWSRSWEGRTESEKRAARLPTTWNDVKHLARFAWTIDRKPREPRVVIQASPEDKAVFLVQLLRSAGLQDVSRVSDPNAGKTFQWLRETYPFVNPEGDEKSAHADWRTTSGFLLSGNVLLARNWAFSLGVLHATGRESEFLIGPGLSFDGEFDPSNLLGGELLALPKKAPNKEIAIQLMKFLLSKEVQTKVVTELSWPATRMDVEGQLSPWQKRYQRILKTALLYARPTPEYWSREVADIYAELFDEIVDPRSPTLRTEELRDWEAQINAARSAAKDTLERTLRGRVRDG